MALTVAKDRAARAAVRTYMRGLAEHAEAPNAEEAGQTLMRALLSALAVNGPGSELDKEMVLGALIELSEEVMAAVLLMNNAAADLGINTPLVSTLDGLIEARRTYFAL
jgi:hypothetical protein